MFNPPNLTSAANPFTEAASEANASWKTAQAALKQAREAFNTGAVVRLKEILGSQSTLQTKLHAAMQERDQHADEFKSAFESAGFEKNAAVQKILNKKNDAIAICEELEGAIGHMKSEHQPAFIQANLEAETYKLAHSRAFDAYGRFYALAILEKHGPPLAEALALLRSVNSGNPVFETNLGPNENYSQQAFDTLMSARMQVLLGKLTKQAMATPSNSELITDAVGTLDIAPLNPRNLLTPGQHHMLKHQAATQAK